MKTICLNMIVKNEKNVICRSLESVKGLIDYWVIVDTGSTDGTQEVIRACMQGVPGQLVERPWVDFAHNRNEALALARGDYVFFIDADEELVRETGFVRPPLDVDYYILKHRFTDLDFFRISLVRNDGLWRWKGVLHESLIHPQAETLSAQTMERVYNIYHDKGGFRASDPKKCANDAAVLEEALKAEPDNARYTFYLAQSYFEGAEYGKSLPVYQKRAAMGDCEQETFWSLFRIGLLQQFQLNGSPAQFVTSYVKAFTYRPSRIEPLYYLANYFDKVGQSQWSYFLLKIALALPRSSDWVFLERWMYDWALEYRLTGAAFITGRYQEAWALARKLMACEALPAKEREALAKDLPVLKKMAKAL